MAEENDSGHSSPSTSVSGNLPPGQHQVELARQMSEQILLRSQPGGRYFVEQELARGAMGVIYLVYDQDLRRTSAMKLVSSELAEDGQRLQSFVDEARVTAQLEHPNIVPVHEIGVLDESGGPYYTMKRVEGEGLHQIINRLAEGDPAYVAWYTRHRLLDIFRKVCDAVDYAHSHSIIHRDIKPENIMVGKFGEVLLMDWGLAKYLDADESAGSREPSMDSSDNAMATQDGVVKGSLAYIAPEQAYGAVDEVDTQTDIFLLGATLYHMFAHAPPYAAGNMQEVLSLAEKCDYRRPSEVNPEAQIPLALERIILKAMAPLKENRYASTGRLIEEIDAFVAGKRVCGRKIFAAGERLILHGEATRDTYVIISGSVRVSRVQDDHEIPIATLGHGDVVEEMAGITHNLRSATVVALTETDTFVISYELLLEELEKLPPWMEKIVFSLADRLRTMDEFLHPLLLRNRAFHIINQIFYLFNSTRIEGKGKQKVSFPRSDLVEEVIINLGIDKGSTEQVLDILVQHGLCKQSRTDAVSLPDERVFRLFADYCRYKFEVAGGTRAVDEIRVTPEEQSYFRQVLRQLRALSERVAR